MPSAYTTAIHGPVFAYAKDDATITAIAWDGRPLRLSPDELLPFPMKPGRSPGISVPDYNVRGVSEIVDLEVDLDIARAADRARRCKSPLINDVLPHVMPAVL